MKTETDYRQVHIEIIGVDHKIQAKGHIKWHIQKMERHGFSKELREMMDAHFKNMRNEMMRICEEINPDLIVEEGGPYIKTPADQWKKQIASGKTVLEERYGRRHIFVDAKIPRFFSFIRKPNNKKREKAFVDGIEKYIHGKRDILNIVLVIGANHLESVGTMLKKKGFDVRIHNVSRDMRSDELKHKVEEEAKRLEEEKIQTKERSFWK